MLHISYAFWLPVNEFEKTSLEIPINPQSKKCREKWKKKIQSLARMQAQLLKHVQQQKDNMNKFNMELRIHWILQQQK